jgi:hypothetical protein
MLSTSAGTKHTDIEAELIHLKDQALVATKSGDAVFFDRYLGADAIAVTPRGVLNRSDILAAVSTGAVRSTSISDTRVLVGSPSMGAVVYQATFDGPAGEWRALVTTTYCRDGSGAWKGVLYQQTAIA